MCQACRATRRALVRYAAPVTLHWYRSQRVLNRINRIESDNLFGYNHANRSEAKWPWW